MLMLRIYIVYLFVEVKQIKLQLPQLIKQSLMSGLIAVDVNMSVDDFKQLDTDLLLAFDQQLLILYLFLKFIILLLQLILIVTSSSQLISEQLVVFLNVVIDDSDVGPQLVLDTQSGILLLGLSILVS